MKLQIDTDKKTIKIEENINLKKLIDSIKKLFPDKEWEGYELQTNTTILNWSSPVYITPKYDWSYKPWNQPMYVQDYDTINCSNQTPSNTSGYSHTVTTLMNSTPHTLTNNIYNLDIQD